MVVNSPTTISTMPTTALTAALMVRPRASGCRQNILDQREGRTVAHVHVNSLESTDADRARVRERVRVDEHVEHAPLANQHVRPVAEDQGRAHGSRGAFHQVRRDVLTRVQWEA